MKDSYSFDMSDSGLADSYQAHRRAYQAIFDRLGINYVICKATSGAMGGSASEEFLAISPHGEDTFVRATEGDYAANVEAVVTPHLILDTVIPIRLIHELRFFVELHEKFRITGIHTSFDTVRYLLIRLIGIPVDTRKFLDAAKRHKRTKTQQSSRMGVYQSIFDHNPVVLPRENDFFRKDYSSYSVNRARHRLHRIFANVFVTVRAETPAFVLVQPQIELGTVLNHYLRRIVA